MQTHYDYIIAGSGAAGLSLVMHILQHKKLASKSILIIDKNTKTKNDRTWCFWQKEAGLFESIVYKSWDSLKVYGAGFEKQEKIAPYTYKMIRGLDFYTHCVNAIRHQPNIHILTDTVQSITTSANQAAVVASNITYTATYVFSSILLQKPQLLPHQHYLLQHFKGAVITTTTPTFTPKAATYMDFRVSQHHGTTFGYVLPITETKALVEYTLFTKNILTPEEYSNGLKSYINQQLGITNYTIIEEEQGIIPMTDYAFKSADGNILYIGTAGGNTRGSTGYTFSYIQKHSKALVTALAANAHPASIKPTISRRAQFYDKVFLSVLANTKVQGSSLFTNMLQNKKITTILSFLDDDNNFVNDIRVILCQPKSIFIKAALQKIFKQKGKSAIPQTGDV